MLNFRIVTAATISLLVSFTIVGGATAQTATNGSPGKPLQLLKIFAQPKQATKPHAKHLAKSSVRARLAAHRITKLHRSVAAARRLRAVTKIAQAPDPVPTPAPASILPDVNSAAPTNAAAAEGGPLPVSAPADAAPSELVIGGQTVQVTSADDVNEIDLAARQNAPLIMATTAPKTDFAAAEPAPQSVAATPEQKEPSPVGSASWIAQVLAALGGAVTAGSVAWFLIGSTPQRMYG
jgi:hypothetical protein